MNDWLLIGGFDHGMVVRVKNRRWVEMFGRRYVGEDYPHSDGELYRIGCCNPTQEQRAAIGALIDQKQPRRIDHD